MNYEELLKSTLKSMLTENTGERLCDSGGAYGRNWQRNQTRDFDTEPSATLRLNYFIDRDGGEHYDIEPTISVYHLLTQNLELDDLCIEFNSMDVKDWFSHKYYCVSAEGENWLDAYLTLDGDFFNTYNGEEAYIHDQILQGAFLKRQGEWGTEHYLLLSIHGGCDVRAGYTHSKLFKVPEDMDEAYGVLSANAVWVLDEEGKYRIGLHGTEQVKPDGSNVDTAYIEQCIKFLGIQAGEPAIFIGDLYV